jgi:hypothetical protein
MLRTRSVQLVATILMATAVCGSSQTHAPSNKTAIGSLSSHSTIRYVSKQFGFRFTLPADWRGYSIVMGEWSGDGNMADVKGPILSIRYPLWTEETPRQDIPIMIFTHRQWRLVDDGTLYVSAAPYGPGEIGRNRSYVFAFPPRYTNAEDEGYEEVIKIMNGQPLHAF